MTIALTLCYICDNMNIVRVAPAIRTRFVVMAHIKEVNFYWRNPHIHARGKPKTLCNNPPTPKAIIIRS